VHEPGRAHDPAQPHGRGQRVPGIFHRHRANPVGREGAQDERHALGEPRADHDPFRVNDRAAHPAQEGGQDLAQLSAAAGVPVVKRVRRRGPAHLAQRPDPVLPRKRRQVLAAGPKGDQRVSHRRGPARHRTDGVA
jgi:hypothetical protein